MIIHIVGINCIGKTFLINNLKNYFDFHHQEIQSSNYGYSSLLRQLYHFLFNFCFNRNLRKICLHFIKNKKFWYGVRASFYYSYELSFKYKTGRLILSDESFLKKFYEAIPLKSNPTENMFWMEFTSLFCEQIVKAVSSKNNFIIFLDVNESVYLSRFKKRNFMTNIEDSDIINRLLVQKHCNRIIYNKLVEYSRQVDDNLSVAWCDVDDINSIVMFIKSVGVK